MKRKIIISLIILFILVVITGCSNNKNINTTHRKKDETSIVGYYQAYETVQYGKKYNEKETKSENITLLIRDDNTATLKWGNSAGKDYKIEKDRFIALAGDEEGKITYKNGIIKIELSDGDYISFKK